MPHTSCLVLKKIYRKLRRVSRSFVKSLQNLRSAYMAGLKSKTFIQSGQQVLPFVDHFVRQLHKNAASNIKQVLEAAPHKATAVQPLTTNQVRWTRHAEHCWRSKNELISDILLWTSSHGRAKAGRPARTYIQQLCADTGCSLEDLPGAMDDKEGWRERVREIHPGGATW